MQRGAAGVAGGSPPSLSPLFVPVSFDDLPGWRGDRQLASLEAFRRSARHAVSVRPYRGGSLGIGHEALAVAFEEALGTGADDDAAARRFFERHFLPCLVRPQDGAAHGFVTAFYEPEVEASPRPTERYRFPLYQRPADLVAVDDTNRPPQMDAGFAFGRMVEGTIAEFPDRRAIETGALAGRGLELAWLADKADVFFIHVQGAARLRMTDGSVKRVTYAAKSGHPFTGPGRVLVELGELKRGDVTMQSIRAWLREHPERVDEILWRNRSFIFFRETDLGDRELGPVAAAKVQLQAGRSLAVDRLLHSFGTPFYVHAPSLTAFDGQPFGRLMVAQDTGSAIVGAARGDIFAGSGDAAGDIAGVVSHDADFYALVPRPLVETMS